MKNEYCGFINAYGFEDWHFANDELKPMKDYYLWLNITDHHTFFRTVAIFKIKLK